MARVGLTVSHHTLRRTARARKDRIDGLAKKAMRGDADARTVLRVRYGLGPYDRVKVESSRRGPFGFRVVVWGTS